MKDEQDEETALKTTAKKKKNISHSNNNNNETGDKSDVNLWVNNLVRLGDTNT